MQSGLERITGHQGIRITTEGLPIIFDVVEGFSYISENGLLSGRFPILENEIVLDTLALAELGKEVGDWVTLSSGDFEKDFIVTGIVQNMDAIFGMMTYRSFRHIQPDFAFSVFFIYVSETTDVDEFIASFEAANADIPALLVNSQTQFEAQFGAMSIIFGAVNVVILIVAAFVVILVLYLLIKTIVIRKRRELGIQKALGFTTLQLMNQIALSLSPSIIIGTTLGATSAYLLFDMVFVGMNRMMGMGIMQASMITPIGLVVVAVLSIIALAYIVSMLVAGRIRKISAYALVSE